MARCTQHDKAAYVHRELLAQRPERVLDRGPASLECASPWARCWMIAEAIQGRTAPFYYEICDEWLRETGNTGLSPFLGGGTFLARAPALHRWLTTFVDHVLRSGDSL